MEKYGAKNIEPATREVMVGYKQVRNANVFEYSIIGRIMLIHNCSHIIYLIIHHFTGWYSNWNMWYN